MTSPLFVGRRRELASLNDARREAGRGRGCLVLIGGEAGIGKSRLLNHFTRLVSEGRARNVAVAECYERAQRPLGPIRALVQGFGRTMHDGDVPSAVRVAHQQLTTYRSLGDDGTETAALERAHLFDALVALLKLVSERRATIAAIEDLQWADASTLDFLTVLAPNLHKMRLMVIATYRSEQLDWDAAFSATIAKLAREAAARQVILEPLPVQDLRDMMAGIIGSSPLPAGTVQEIEERCDGNPFFAEELLKNALMRSGESKAVTLPISIRATIMERLLALDESERRVLQRAAVLGYRFDPRLLAHVMGCEVESLLPALRRARSMQIVVDDKPDRSTCRFRHALTHRTIYEDMLAFDLRRMHEQIVASIELLPQSESYVDELAYHSWQARDALRTLLYNERAAEMALNLRALPEAATLFQRALDVAGEPDDQARLLTRLGTIAQLRGRLHESVDTFERALSLRLACGNYDDAAFLHGWIAGDLYNNGNERGLHRAKSFLETHGERLGKPAYDWLAVFLARMLSTHVESGEAERLLSGVLPDELPPRARVNYVLAQVNRFGYKGDVAAWKRAVSDFAVFSASVPEFLRVIAWCTIAQQGTYLAAHDEVESALNDADRLLGDWSLPSIEPFKDSIYANYLWTRGRLSTARECLERVLAADGPFVARSTAAYVAPLVAVALDDDALVSRCLTEDVARIADSGEGDGVELICAARGTWLARRGRLEEARRDLRSGLRTVCKATPLQATLFVGCARYLDEDEWKRLLELSDPTQLHPEDASGLAVSRLVAAIIALRNAPEAAAQCAADEAATMFAALGWPLFQAQALEVAGRREAALALYLRCGAVGDVRRLTPARGRPALAKETFSARESEIAELVTEGMSNVEIAQRLSVSTKTVEKHLSAIFGKLGIRSRAQIAAFVAREEREFA